MQKPICLFERLARLHGDSGLDMRESPRAKMTIKSRVAKPAKVNIYDVASSAKVSIASVSRTINGDSRVNRKIQRKVWQAVQALGYTPNPYARAFRSGRSGLVGAIISATIASRFPGILSCIEEAANSRGMDVLISTWGETPEAMNLAIRKMRQRKVTRLFLADGKNTELETLLDQDIPPSCARTHRVLVDYTEGIHQAVQHLAVLGHRKIAMTGMEKKFDGVNPIEASFERAMESINAPTQIYCLKGYAASDRTKHLAGLFRKRDAPTAILCSGNLDMMLLMSCILAQKLSIPEDVSIVCCEDSELSLLEMPAITALSIAREKLVSDLRAVVSSNQDSSANSRFVKASLHLTIRSSTASPKHSV